MFDDHVPGGFRITYVIDEEHERILVVRIRKHCAGTEHDLPDHSLASTRSALQTRRPAMIDGTDHRSHGEQSSMIRRYIA